MSRRNTEILGDVPQRMRQTERDLDRIRGSMIGGAVGDALGYAVEFLQERQIFEMFGEDGITAYVLTDGKALISDDTQMSLFTANGLLVGDTRGRMCGIQGSPRGYVLDAYRDWYRTQTRAYQPIGREERLSCRVHSWLLDIPELYERRAPGITCLSALKTDADREDYIKEPVNDSKGCGGIMRAAPAALRYRPGSTFSGSFEDVDAEAAQIAAITHGHSLGYMPAAVLCHIIGRILQDGENASLSQIVVEAVDTAEKLFAGDCHLDELVRIVNLAVELSENGADDLENIHRLGEGWVAEETLAIAVYCSLKYRTDFSAAVIAAVNHSGDSDSTGAVTGNIVGALVGYDAIDEKWKTDLELRDVILEMADDLCHGCTMSEYSRNNDQVWAEKYIQMRRCAPKARE